MHASSNISNMSRCFKAVFHYGRFARAREAGFENLLTRAWRASKTMHASPAQAKRP